MAEFLGYLWLGSFLVSLPFTLWNVVSVLQTARKPEMRVLNDNLAKAGLFWSLSTESLLETETHSNPDEDLKKSLRGMILLGGLGLLSLLGLLFLMIVSISLRVLIRNKKTEIAFKSPLAHDPDLTEEQVKDLITMLR